MKLKLLASFFISFSVHAAGGEGPGQFFGVIHNNFDTQTVEARDIDNNLYAISRDAFSEKDEIYHGRIIHLLIGAEKIKFLRKLSPEKDIIGKAGKPCVAPRKNK